MLKIATLWKLNVETFFNSKKAQLLLDSGKRWESIFYVKKTADMCNFFAMRVFVDMGFDTIEKVKKNDRSLLDVMFSSLATLSWLWILI